MSIKKIILSVTSISIVTFGIIELFAPKFLDKTLVSLGLPSIPADWRGVVILFVFIVLLTLISLWLTSGFSLEARKNVYKARDIANLLILHGELAPKSGTQSIEYQKNLYEAIVLKDLLPTNELKTLYGQIIEEAGKLVYHNNEDWVSDVSIKMKELRNKFDKKTNRINRK